MHIKLEYPYTEEWDFGCLTYRKKQRRMYVVFARRKDRKTTSTAYARYLMSVKLGRKLEKDETVDHIDNNRLNDSLDNLQLLSRSDNVAKYYSTVEIKHGTGAMYRRGCRCPACREHKRKEQHRYLMKKKQNKLSEIAS